MPGPVFSAKNKGNDSYIIPILKGLQFYNLLKTLTYKNYALILFNIDESLLLLLLSSI